MCLFPVFFFFSLAPAFCPMGLPIQAGTHHCNVLSTSEDSLKAAKILAGPPEHAEMMFKLLVNSYFYSFFPEAHENFCF